MNRSLPGWIVFFIERDKSPIIETDTEQTTALLGQLKKLLPQHNLSKLQAAIANQDFTLTVDELDAIIFTGGKCVTKENISGKKGRVHFMHRQGSGLIKKCQPGHEGC